MNKLYIWKFDAEKGSFPAVFWALATSETEALEQLERRYPKNYSLIAQYEPDEIAMKGDVGAMLFPSPEFTVDELKQMLAEKENSGE